jgi:gluconate 2-dehydrogenase gamma chain
MKDKSAQLCRRTLLGAGLSAAIGCRGGKPAGAWRFFTPDEARTVEAICAQLIPTDDFPGAKEAGVVYYIDLQLGKRFKKHRAAYRDGIAAVDSIALKNNKKRFTELAEAEQVEVLNAVEEQHKAFFNLILAHTRQGFYGDPRHGGNRGMVSWHMLGLATPQVRGRQHYDEGKSG